MEHTGCWRRWGVLWLLLLLTGLPAAISFGRAPPGPDLPEQVLRSELIVVGKLQPYDKRVLLPARKGDKFRYSVVDIQVEEVLKGKAGLKTVPLRSCVGFVEPFLESTPGFYQSRGKEPRGIWILTPERGQFVGSCLDVEKREEILALLPGVKRPAATRPAPATQPLDARAAADLIRHLGADDFATREAAMKKLIEAGDAVRPLVEQQLKSADPEVAHRAELILARLSVGLGSKPVEKDGLSVSILPRKRAFGRGEMPSFLVVFKNVSERPLRLDADRYLVNWKFAAGPNAHIVFREYQQALRGAAAGKQDQQLLRHLPPGQTCYVALTAEQFYLTEPLGTDKPGGRDEQPPPVRILPPTEGVYELSVYIWLGQNGSDSWRGELTTNPASFAVAFHAPGGALLPVPQTPAPPKAGPLTITGHFRHGGKPLRGMPAGELWGDDGYTYTVWSEAQVDMGLDRKPVRVKGKCWGPMMHEGKLMHEKLTIEGAKVTPADAKSPAGSSPPAADPQREAIAGVVWYFDQECAKPEAQRNPLLKQFLGDRTIADLFVHRAELDREHYPPCCRVWLGRSAAQIERWDIEANLDLKYQLVSGWGQGQGSVGDVKTLMNVPTAEVRKWSEYAAVVAQQKARQARLEATWPRTEAEAARILKAVRPELAENVAGMSKFDYYFPDRVQRQMNGPKRENLCEFQFALDAKDQPRLCLMNQWNYEPKEKLPAIEDAKAWEKVASEYLTKVFGRAPAGKLEVYSPRNLPPDCRNRKDDSIRSPFLRFAWTEQRDGQAADARQVVTFEVQEQGPNRYWIWCTDTSATGPAPTGGAPQATPQVAATAPAKPIAQEAVPLARVCRITIAGPELKVEPVLPWRDGASMRIAELPGKCVLGKRNGGIAIDHESSARDGVVLSSIEGSPATDSIARTVRNARESYTVQLKTRRNGKREPRLLLTLTVNNPANGNCTAHVVASADSLDDLRRQHPQPVATYLDPLLRQLNVTSQAASTQPAATQPVDGKAVAELIRLLGDDAFAVREDATGKLIAMGTAVHPILKARLQEAALDPEIAFRIRTILDTRPPAPAAARSVTDPDTGMTFTLSDDGAEVGAAVGQRMMWRVRLATPATGLRLDGQRLIVLPRNVVYDAASGKCLLDPTPR